MSDVAMQDGGVPRLEAFLEPFAQAPPPIVAVVQPVTEVSLAPVFDAADRGCVQPLLVGDRDRIVPLLRLLGRDANACEIVDVHGDAGAAEEAVALARAGRAEILMKGHLHTDDFLRPAVDARHGLRTGARMSHAFLCFLDARIHAKPLLITDAAMNVAPDARAKTEIVRNAAAFLRALGVKRPKVAVLAATESVDPGMPATLDAQLLAELGSQGEFGDAVVEGPFGFDNAISADAARTKGIVSSVAGDPDILLVPQIEAGNILYKSLVYLCGAIAPGFVLGARVPMLLTSRADPPLARTAACAIAARMIRNATVP